MGTSLKFANTQIPVSNLLLKLGGKTSVFGSKVIAEQLAEPQVFITSWAGLASVGRRAP